MRTIRTLELAKVGEWGMSSDPITGQDLKEVVETFTPRRPVGIGHEAMRRDDAPKYGNVWSVALADNGNTLTGEVEFTDALDTLYTSGAYDGWSVSIPKRAKDGKAYLHHLAFLGATPPKIPGLKELEVKPFSYADGDVKRSFQFSGNCIECAGEEMKAMNEQEVKALQEKLAALEKENAELKAVNEKAAADKKELEEKLAALEGEEKKEEAIPAEFADRMQRIEKEARVSRLSAFKAKIEGKVPAGIASQAAALAERLSGRTDAFNFSDNGTNVQGTELEALGALLMHWPEPVSVGSSGFDYSDSAGSAKDEGAASCGMRMLGAL